MAAERKYKQSLVYEYLKNSIISGKLPPEKQLVEQEICDKLNVSRTPVREALRILSSEGLVDYLPGCGVVVASLTWEKATALYELKEAIETSAVRFCCQRATPEELEKLTECVSLHRKAFENDSMSMVADVDLQFHAMLLQFAHSPMLEETGRSILTRTRRLSQLAVYDTDQITNFIAQHEAILNAVKEDDPARAAKAVADHIRYVKDFQYKRWSMLF